MANYGTVYVMNEVKGELHNLLSRIENTEDTDGEDLFLLLHCAVRCAAIVLDVPTEDITLSEVIDAAYNEFGSCYPKGIWPSHEPRIKRTHAHSVSMVLRGLR